MLTGEIRNQIDAIWNAFWSGGISNPLEVIEQITYLLFIRRRFNTVAITSIDLQASSRNLREHSARG
jgi:HsdM N-terminal domain